MSDLLELRNEIDHIDSQIFSLFAQRANVACAIGDYKREHGLAVYDPGRERDKISQAGERVPEELKTYAQVLMQLLMEAAKSKETLPQDAKPALLSEIEQARATTPELFPADANVACQGVEGAYSQIAAAHFFKHPMISYCPSFEGVFQAVEDGRCSYGVLPVENSTAGTVNKVFDLMMEHSFHVVRTYRQKIDHNLLAKPGAKIEDICDIYSHEQAINQCRHYLETLPNARVHVCENTAMAARLVAESNRADVAALSSRSCADLYGLDILASNVQDRDNNYTRFACISKHLEIYPGADRTTLMLVLNHEPGALYKVLAKIYALDLNLLKLESRPIPQRDFEFMFYFDIDCPVAAPQFEILISSLSSACQELRYLGSYTEVI